MIKFNADNKLLWKKINKDQVPTYIHFLNTEIGRHMIERAASDQKVQTALRERPQNKLLAELWCSAWNRHIKDIHEIEKLVREVKEYNFEAKE